MGIFDSFVNGLLAMGDSLCPREDYSYKKYIYMDISQILNVAEELL